MCREHVDPITDMGLDRSCPIGTRDDSVDFSLQGNYNEIDLGGFRLVDAGTGLAEVASFSDWLLLRAAPLLLVASAMVCSKCGDVQQNIQDCAAEGNFGRCCDRGKYLYMPQITMVLFAS